MDKSSRTETRDENPCPTLSIQQQAEELRPICTSRQWLEDLQPYSIPAMAYKFGNGKICQPRWAGKSL